MNRKSTEFSTVDETVEHDIVKVSWLIGRMFDLPLSVAREVAMTSSEDSAFISAALAKWER